MKLNKKRSLPASRQGFTLVELLVVIAVIGLLSGMVVISITQAKAKSRDARRVADINTIVTALNLYHNDYNAYPIYDGYIEDQTNTLAIELVGAGTISGLPIDPLNSGNYRYYYQSTAGRDFYMEYYLETTSMSGKPQGKNYVIP